MLVWILEQDVGGKDNKCSDEFWICVSNLELVGLEGICLLVVKFLFVLGDVWCFI